MRVGFGGGCTPAAEYVCPVIVDDLFGAPRHNPFFIWDATKEFAQMNWFEVCLFRGVMKVDCVDGETVKNT